MNFYISDLHFGCVNSYEKRTLELDEIIIKNWNKVVTNADTVYILGDVGKFGNNSENEYLCSVISKLKGKKILIKGNHDKIKDYRLKQLFYEIYDYKEIIDNYNNLNYNLVLSHYPIMCWNGQHKGWVLLYGHTHNTDEDIIYKKCLNMFNEYFEDKTLKGYTDCPKAQAINVGSMCSYINNVPRTLKEILESERK